jgi:hypothetical protein
MLFAIKLEFEPLTLEPAAAPAPTVIIADIPENTGWADVNKNPPAPPPPPCHVTPPPLPPPPTTKTSTFPIKESVVEVTVNMLLDVNVCIL